MKSVVPAALIVLVSLAHAGERLVTLSMSMPTMDCPACPITIKKALAKVSGVHDVKVSFEQRTAVASFDDRRVSVDQLIRATRNAGYPSVVKEGGR